MLILVGGADGPARRGCAADVDRRAGGSASTGAVDRRWPLERVQPRPVHRSRRALTAQGLASAVKSSGRQVRSMRRWTSQSTYGFPIWIDPKASREDCAAMGEPSEYGLP
jgi:hypothetical protein